MRKVAFCNFMAGSGKDTLADHLVDNYGFKKYSFADKVYEVSKDLFGMTEKDRPTLVAVAEKMREINPKVWLNYCMNQIEEEGFEKIIISDVRKRVEYEHLKEQGWELIMIYCTPVEAVKRLKKRDKSVHENIIVNASLDSELRDLVEIIPTVDNSDGIEESISQLEEILFNRD